jgi:hypothetical protein
VTTFSEERVQASVHKDKTPRKARSDSPSIEQRLPTHSRRSLARRRYRTHGTRTRRRKRHRPNPRTGHPPRGPRPRHIRNPARDRRERIPRQYLPLRLRHARNGAIIVRRAGLDQRVRRRIQARGEELRAAHGRGAVQFGAVGGQRGPGDVEGVGGRGAFGLDVYGDEFEEDGRCVAEAVCYGRQAGACADAGDDPVAGAGGVGG